MTHLMKVLPFSAFILLGVTLSAFAQPVEQKVVVIDPARPDITLQTIFSGTAQGQLFKQVRETLKKSSGFDPLSHSFEPIHVDADINSEMAKELRKMIEAMTNLRLDRGNILVDIEGLHIETPNPIIQLGGISAVKGGIDFSVRVRLQKTVAVADKITVRMKPNPGKRSFADSFFIELRNTSVEAESLDSLSMDLSVHTRTQADGSTKISFDPSVLSVFDDVTADALANDLTFDPGKIRVPELTVQIGNTRLPLRKDNLGEQLTLHRATIARMMMDPLAKKIRTVPSDLFSGKAPELTVPAVIEFDVPCLGKVGVSVMRYGQIGKDQIQLGLKIRQEGYPANENGHEYFDQATEATYGEIDHDRSSVVMGIGYRPISWAIQKILTGCMKDKIPSPLSLGPSGAEVRLDHGGNGIGIFALDVQAKMKWYIGLLLGRQKIDFPLKVAPRLSVRAGTETEETKLLLDFTDVDLSSKTLRDGYSTIQSNVQDLNFSPLVVKLIRAQAMKVLPKAKIEIPLHFANGSDLKFADIRSDGFGNLNLNLTLDPTTQSQAKDFWSKFTDFMKNLHQKKALSAR